MAEQWKLPEGWKVVLEESKRNIDFDADGIPGTFDLVLTMPDGVIRRFVETRTSTWGTGGRAP